MKNIRIQYDKLPVILGSDIRAMEEVSKAKVIPTKTVDPDKLVDEVRKNLNQVKFPQNIRQFPTVDGIIKLSVSLQPKFYSLLGDTYLLRDLLPRNESYGRKKSPLFNRKWGYMYFKNPENQKELYRLLSVAKAANRKYKGYSIETEGPQNKKWGIVGWDVKYVDPKWVIDITGTGWRPRSNPEMLRDGTWIFRKCSFSTTAASKALSKVRRGKKGGKEVWKSLYPKLLEYKKGRLTNLKDWRQFIEDPDYRAALAGWAGHARYLFKDIGTKTIHFYDPWMQSLGKSPALRTVAKEFPEWKVQFEKRRGEQGVGEGSCAVIALIRAILTAEYGKSGATTKIPPSYAVLGSRVLSITR